MIALDDAPLPTMRDVCRFRSLAGRIALDLEWPQLLEALDAGHDLVRCAGHDSAHLVFTLASASTDSEVVAEALRTFADSLAVFARPS